MLRSLLNWCKKLFFIHIVYIILNVNDVLSAGISSKFINVVVDDSLYYPFNALASEFVQKNDIILNIKYVNNDFYKKLSYDEKMNIFITQKNNKSAIEKHFNIKASNFIGVTTYCLCINQDFDLQNTNILSLNDLEKNNVFNNIAVGSKNSTFFLNIKLRFNKVMSEYDDSLIIMQDLYSKKYDVGLFLYPMCSSQKKMTPIYIIDSLDLKNKSEFIVDYRIYAVNQANETIQKFLSFVSNSAEINDLLKNYGIIGKSRQFSQN